MRLDMHTHTAGVSFCSEVSPRDYVQAYKQAGVSAVVLTNHYSRMYMYRYGDTFAKQIDVYLQEYDTAADWGAKMGVRVILGAEVAISTPQSPYIEFLLYGATAAFFRKHPSLYDCTQRRLYEICRDEGVLMMQSHPFRSEQGHVPMDPQYMDGTEINCHKNFLRREEQVRAFADEHGLSLVCGSDFHFLSQAGSAWTEVADEVTDSPTLAAYLRKNPRPSLFYR